MSGYRINKSNIRRSFGRSDDIVPVPNLIEIQSSSFNDFVQLDYLPDERAVIGLEKVLREVFSVSHEDKLSLEYVSYELGHWACTCSKLIGIENRYQWTCQSCEETGCSRLNKTSECSSCHKSTAQYKVCSNCFSRVTLQLPVTLDECRVSGQTFSMPLKIKMQLISWSKDEQGARVVHDIKEQDIFFADVPVMADVYEDEGRFKVGNLGTFLINGVDRVVVSQLHRSPGVVFSQSKKVKDFRGRPYYLARIIPMRGSWLDFEFDSNDYLYVRIDKKKKMFVTTFLQALGYAREDLLDLFYQFDTIHCAQGVFSRLVDNSLIGLRIEKGMLAGDDTQFVGKRINKELLETFKKLGFTELAVGRDNLLSRVFGKDLIDPETGEIIAEQGEVFSEYHIDILARMKSIHFLLVHSSGYVFQPTVAMTLAQDGCRSLDDSLKEVHAKLWAGDNSSLEEIKDRFEQLFFNSRAYDLTPVGRIRINRKLSLSGAEFTTTLTREDIVATVRYLVNLRERGEGVLDDIDHLGNRRVRLVGELLNNQMYLGFMRIERIIRERFRMQDAHTALMPQDFLNVKPLGAVLREFFGMGQLSQFMDQTNPLAELAHKRRLSALGPGGVLKDRATYEVRDVHTSHYGRICPIETPEGQTIGLISSLATYATVNKLGFIETGYRPVVKGKIEGDVVFLDAFQETDCYIAQADANVSKKQELVGDTTFVRHGGNFVYAPTSNVDYIDLSSKQLVSVSAALIPFLEHDDAVRALMGANMQRQAVPLIRARTPIVGTGMEKDIVRESGAVITAKRGGVVVYVSSEKILIRVQENHYNSVEEWVSGSIDTYNVKKFLRSSYSTWIHHTPVVRPGDVVNKGDILTNGPSIERNELALGTNLLVAFMPWHGYNFEDAIVLSKRLVADDALTSVHIDEYIVEARDTKLGPEEITRDIPNIGESALACLDEDGVVRVGTRVRPGDILVGKVTLKGDIQYSPEEKLLRAIFGEKSREVRDTSLRVPPGIEGTVIDVKVFSRSGVKKDRRYKVEIDAQIAKFEIDYAQHLAFFEAAIVNKLVSEFANSAHTGIMGSKLTDTAGIYQKDLLLEQTLDTLFKLKSKSKEVNDRVKRLHDAYQNQLRILQGFKEERINKLRRGDSLPSGVIKMIKVYIGSKRAVAVGDKIAGRHGNKGVVSNIVPREDMPYLDDGTPIDIILNPLGVPSRMNVGQLLETALGFVGKKMGDNLAELLTQQNDQQVFAYLASCYGSEFVGAYRKSYGDDGLYDLAKRSAAFGVQFETPVFESANLDKDIMPLMEELGIPNAGSYHIRDGRSGDYFDQPVTVGCMYIMKLNHMVDDKLHARSVGPYSLVTQQPLGGKAQQGGQRLGEMEVWALEAYGAAYALQEMLTYKSDDVTGRHKAYEAIIRGGDVPEPGVPESFNVLIKELQSLGLQVDLLKVGKENVGD